MRGSLTTRVAMGLALMLGAAPRANSQTAEDRSDVESKAAPGDIVAPDPQAGQSDDLESLSRLGTMVPQTPITILLAPAVQSELKLTDEQKTKAYGLALASNQKQRDLYRSLMASPENDAASLAGARADLRQDNEEAVARILEPKQAQRLNEVVLQFEGPLAVSREDVARRLRLSEEQNASIREIMLGLQMQQRALVTDARRKVVTFSQLDPSRFERVRGQMGKLRDKAVVEIGKVLERKQKVAFNKMLGAPFDLGKLKLAGSTSSAEAADKATDVDKASTAKSEGEASKKGAKPASQSGRRTRPKTRR